jgi:hypothetical protein
MDNKKVFSLKKILISLILVFGVFFSFGNLQVNAEISNSQKNNLNFFK